jgi:hypothetical protein
MATVRKELSAGAEPRRTRSWHQAWGRGGSTGVGGAGVGLKAEGEATELCHGELGRWRPASLMPR